MKNLLLALLLLFTACSSQNVTLPEREGGTNPVQDELNLENVTFNIPKELQAYYKNIDFSKEGTELREELAILTIEKHTILSYTDRHKYLYKADKSENDAEKVVLLYTGEVRFWKEYEGNNGYRPQTFNTEHVYPRSKINLDAVADLHHLRVCDSRVNTERGNHPFAEGKGNARLIGKSWYPGDEWKGDVARMILYLNLRYNEKLDSRISVGGIDLLLKWNAEDPVSAIEKNRNNVIEQAQGNRNPFIDNPFLATLMWKKYNAENRWK